jgi:hypothetical protein
MGSDAKQPFFVDPSVPTDNFLIIKALVYISQTCPTCLRLVHTDPAFAQFHYEQAATTSQSRTTKIGDGWQRITRGNTPGQRTGLSLRAIRDDDFAALAGKDEDFAVVDIGQRLILQEIFAE